MDATDREQEARRERLRAWLRDHGGHAAVVERRRLKSGQASFLSQVVNGYSFGPRAARNMEQRLGMPERYLEPQYSAAAPASMGVAQEVIPAPYTLPVKLAWEAVMQATELPNRFMLEMPDDALAPSVARGMFLLFETGATPTPGVGVLVLDHGGRRYVRRYAEGRAGAWVAQAINPAYATLESERDGLQVLAVMTGRLGGAV